jgi:chaperone modulatory protein CbpM
MTALLGVEELASLLGVQAEVLEGWLAEGWVRPEREGTAWRFDAVDVARARLVAEMLRDLAVPPETVSMMLSLLDQAHGMRRQMHRLLEALSEQPPEVSRSVLRRARLIEEA